MFLLYGADAIKGSIMPYSEFVLCREMGWTFTELEQQPAYRIYQAMRFMKIESDVREIKRKEAEMHGRR